MRCWRRGFLQSTPAAVRSSRERSPLRTSCWWPSAPGPCRRQQNSALMYRKVLLEEGCRSVWPRTAGFQGCPGTTEDICSAFGIWPEGPRGSSNIPGWPQLHHVLLTTVDLSLLMSWVRSARRTGGTGGINTLLVGVLILLQVNSVGKLCLLASRRNQKNPFPTRSHSQPRSNSLPAPEHIFYFHHFPQFAF